MALPPCEQDDRQVAEANGEANRATQPEGDGRDLRSGEAEGGEGSGDRTGDEGPDPRQQQPNRVREAGKVAMRSGPFQSKQSEHPHEECHPRGGREPKREPREGSPLVAYFANPIESVFSHPIVVVSARVGQEASQRGSQITPKNRNGPGGTSHASGPGWQQWFGEGRVSGSSRLPMRIRRYAPSYCHLHKVFASGPPPFCGSATIALVSDALKR